MQAGSSTAWFFDVGRGLAGRKDPTFTADREAAALERLERIAPTIPAPRVMGAAVHGEAGEVPAILLTRLPGRPRPHDVAPPAVAIAWLAEQLVEIHAVDESMREVAPPFELFYELRRLAPPHGTRRPDIWNRALELAGTEPPPRPLTFLHRDYHPGNILWVGPNLTGIVDWTGASWGPPAADLGHLRANLAMDHGPAIANFATAAYRAAGGTDYDSAWWDGRMLLDWGPDQEKPTSTESLERIERYLVALLANI
jgi:aminoglycoside phosphotransferase (APT) family kinase protein